MPLHVYRGDTLQVTFDIEDVDITGSTVFWTVKSNLTDADSAAVIAKANTLHTDAHNTTFICSSTEVSSLLGEYVYDVQLKSSTGSITTVVMDTINFAADVTIRTT